MTSGDERRTEQRYTAHFDVRFARATDAAKAFNAYSINFSSGGLCVRSRSPHVLGEQLSLSLTIEGDQFDLEGVVSWVRGDAVGVRFVNVALPIRDRLEKVARVLASRPVT